MGVNAVIYATGVTPAQRDLAEAQIAEIMRYKLKDLVVPDRPQWKGDPGTPRYKSHYLTFASEESWSHSWKEGDLDTLEVRTFLRWPQRGWWPDLYALIRAFQASLPEGTPVYFAPDSSCSFDADPETLVTPERMEAIWREFLLADQDSYYTKL
ncbi:hypothetical protein SEA_REDWATTLEHOG_66 [Gordonia phage RedWattleHog]|uniref:Uncharacterized protein n=1 Tax=Gordonia phage Stormageddon TaxID=2656541 RepID=A0A649VR31_9CAUD|nr:hypothetical protein KHQ86_gp063 [Gordonia phage Stormageddon]QGJ94926.1 hypothetical protein SEA_STORMAGEDDON_63 [Gordonia phage Stormageddon]QLF83570.1 hypothetical protein SEA_REDWATTLEHOG_66 [Gordonia phage RedWattleHog]